jgi:hypothetical protein
MLLNGRAAVEVHIPATLYRLSPGGFALTECTKAPPSDLPGLFSVSRTVWLVTARWSHSYVKQGGET